MNKDYITYEEQDPFGNNEVFIMQKRFPNYCGKLTVKPETNWYQPVHGYNLFVFLCRDYSREPLPYPPWG